MARRQWTLCPPRETVIEYLSRTSIHGLKYIADRDIHWSERFFWLIACCVSLYYCTLFIIESWKVVHSNPISFVVDTNYLNWNTSFPAVSICEQDNANVFKVADELFGEEHDYNLDEVIREMAFFRGNLYYTVDFCDENLPCPKDGLEEIAKMVRSPCEDIFERCSWNDEEFDCCSHFKKILTEIGTCYSINAIQASETLERNHKSFDRKVGPGTLNLRVKVESRVYLHSSEDVPNLNSQDPLVTAPFVQYYKRFSVQEVQNGEDVVDIDPKKRRCKFPFERSEKYPYPHYSYSACTVQCRLQHERKICNCTPPLTPSAAPEDACDLAGILCVNDIFGTISVQKSEWNQLKKGLYCPCLPSCEEIQINTIEQYGKKIPEDVQAVQLVLDKLPSERYLRKVVRGSLDLAVALGGTCGLFVGASLLSVIELLYYCIIRSYCASREGKKGRKRRKKRRKKPMREANVTNLYPITSLG